MLIYLATLVQEGKVLHICSAASEVKLNHIPFYHTFVILQDPTSYFLQVKIYFTSLGFNSENTFGSSQNKMRPFFS